VPNQHDDEQEEDDDEEGDTVFMPIKSNDDDEPVGYTTIHLCISLSLRTCRYSIGERQSRFTSFTIEIRQYIALVEIMSFRWRKSVEVSSCAMTNRNTTDRTIVHIVFIVRFKED
jgi:hypothetical protein